MITFCTVSLLACTMALMLNTLAQQQYGKSIQTFYIDAILCSTVGVLIAVLLWRLT